MASGNIEKRAVSMSYEFDVDFVPLPPGTKSRAKLWRGPGADPRLLIGRLPLAAMLLAALAIGVLIGRFLVP